MIFGQDRNKIRQFFFQAWKKRRDGAPLEPLEQMIVAAIERHPEYHKLLEAPEQSVARDFSPELGETNPFLHLGMHIAIAEQLSVDRPPGIVRAYQAIVNSVKDPHEAEHCMMECLSEVLWQAQRANAAPDDAAYLACLERITKV